MAVQKSHRSKSKKTIRYSYTKVKKSCLIKSLRILTIKKKNLKIENLF